MSDNAFTLLVIILSSAHTASCQALEVDNFFVVADTERKNLYHVEYTTGVPTQLLENDERASPFAVAYDPDTRLVYWSDHAYRSIDRYSLIWRNSSRIFTKGTSKIDGLSVDSVNQKLYYTDDSIIGVGVIGVMSTDGSDHRVLVQIYGSHPRAVVVDSHNRLLYWTDWSTIHPGIYRAPLSNVSTSSREPLITTDITWPNALTIDFTAGVMYFGDGKLDTIEMANLDGSGRVLVLNESSTESHYFALALDTQFIYFTDWSHSSSSRYIRKMHRTSLETSIFMSSVSFGAVNGLVRFVSPAALTTTVEALTATTEGQGRGQAVLDSTTSTTTAAGDSSEFPLTLVIAVAASAVAVVIIILIIICIVVVCKWRRGMIEKATDEEQRREKAEEQLHYQVQRRKQQQQQQQRRQETPGGDAGVYEEVDMEAYGYSIPNFLKTDKSSRVGYEQLPERVPTPPEPRAPRIMARGNSYVPEPEPHYSRSLPPVYDNT